jgi:WD40 repeat protein
MEGSVGERTLYTVTSDVWNLEEGPDGNVYLNMIDRPADVVLLSLDGSPAERVGGFSRVHRPALLAVLPDGRAVVPAGGWGNVRLMAVARGKDPVPLVNTAEETASPLAVVGTREIAFVIGPEPRQVIAIADVASGRVMRRLVPNKGAVLSLAASPDGKTIFFAASGRIWSIPATGGEAKALRPGDSVVVEPNGHDLIVKMNESSRGRLFRVPLDGSAEREIVLDGSNRLVPVWPLTPGAIHPDGRMLVSLLPVHSWFNPIGVLDLASGRIKRTLDDTQNDFHTMSWTADGKIMTLKTGLHAALWKFSAARH